MRHKEIGEYEPTFPSIEVQNKWSKDEYDNAMIQYFYWATLTQEDAKGHSVGLAALRLSGHFPELIEGVENSSMDIPHTTAWLLRMAHLGLQLRFHERKFIVRDLHKLLDNPKVSASSTKTAKPNIQDFINAKLKKAMGDIDEHFDTFITNGYAPVEYTVLTMLQEPENTPPANRLNDLVDHATKFLTEFRLAASGKDAQLAEAYSHLSKAQLKACIKYWESAITDINSFGQLKKAVRKTRKKKAVPVAKVVGKLKYVKTFPALGLVSIDPAQLLKATEVWVFNTKNRKLGHYVALPNSTFDIKGTRLLNLDTVKCIQKTLRKPAEQLKQFNNLSKIGAVKWLNGIHAVATPLREAINGDSILLKVIK